MRRGAALLIAALAAGCGTREHANPFDPQNPVTNGRPAGFAAFAGPGQVELRWTPPVLAGDYGYQLFRRLPGEAEFSRIGPDFGRNSSYYADIGLVNGALHEYRLFYVFSGAAGGLPADDVATPGPLRPWCTDLSRRSLVGMTPDGRRQLPEHVGFLGPTHLAVDPVRSTIWISDTYDGRVVNLNPDTGGRFVISGGLAEPVAIALDPFDRSVWVCDQTRDAVMHFTAAGFPGTPSQLPGLETPIGLAIDPTSGTVWVCERGGNLVHRFARSGDALGATTLGVPSRVAVDSANGDAWATSFEGAKLVRITAAGEAQDTVSLSGPIGVAVDPRRGRIWVADARAHQLVAVSRAGVIVHRVGGLTQVREVDVDLATGDAWATVPGLRQVVRVSESGAVLQRLGGFSDPYGIALDPGN